MIKKLLIVQKGGDFREAYRNLGEGKPEYYANQQYSVGSVIQLKNSLGEVASLCCHSLGAYSELLEPGLRAIGIGVTKSDSYKVAMKKTIQAIQEYRPDYVILRTPALEILRWLRRKKIPASMILADSFNGTSLRNKWWYFQLGRECSHSNVRWIGNHGVGSSLSLRKIGVKESKIIPWDWPVFIDPSLFPTKTLKISDKQPSLLYVGVISADKGVTDCIEAVAHLRDSGFPVTLDIYGQGDIDGCRRVANQFSVEDSVNFCGLVPNSEIVGRMANSDLVLIPSRRTYPEGFPKTINEALCSHSPLVVSDHPIFARILKNRVNAMVFKAGSPASLASRVKEILGDEELYRSLSDNAHSTWTRLQIPVKWGELLKNIALNSSQASDWLTAHRLNSGLYDLSS